MKEYINPLVFFDEKFSNLEEVLLRKKEILLEFDIKECNTLKYGKKLFDRNGISFFFDELVENFTFHQKLFLNDSIFQYLNGTLNIDAGSLANLKDDTAFIIWLKPYFTFSILQNFKKVFDQNDVDNFKKHQEIANVASNFNIIGYNALKVEFQAHCNNYIVSLVEKYSNFQFYNITFEDEEIVEEWSKEKHEIITCHFLNSENIFKYQTHLQKIICIFLNLSMNNILNFSSILLERILYFDEYLAEANLACFTLEGRMRIKTVLKQRVYVKRRKYALMTLPIFIFILYLVSPSIVKAVKNLALKIRGEITITNHDTKSNNVFIEFKQNTIPKANLSIPKLYFNLFKPYFPKNDSFIISGIMTAYKNQFNQKESNVEFKYLATKDNSIFGYKFENILPFLKEKLLLKSDFSNNFKLLGVYPDFNQTNIESGKTNIGFFELMHKYGGIYAMQYYNQKRALVDVDTYIDPFAEIDDFNTEVDKITNPIRMVHDYFLLNYIVLLDGKAKIEHDPKLSYYFSNSKNLSCVTHPGVSEDQFIVEVTGAGGNEKMYYTYLKKAKGIHDRSLGNELEMSREENKLIRLSQSLYEYPKQNEIISDMNLIGSDEKWVIGAE